MHDDKSRKRKYSEAKRKVLAQINPILERLERQKKVNEALSKLPPELVYIYETAIDKPQTKFEKSSQHRFFEDILSRLYGYVTPEVMLQLLEILLLTHAPDYLEEVAWQILYRKLVHQREVKYQAELNANERTVYLQLKEPEQSAFRICRDLSFHNKVQKWHFFLPCNSLGARLGKGPQQASRILLWLERIGILRVVQKGTQRKPGQKPRATTYEWLLHS
jgi:hypothetical protein